MKKSLLFLIFFLKFYAVLFAQNEIQARLELEEAEYNIEINNYQKALRHIAEAEKLTGEWNPRISYAKILSLEALSDLRNTTGLYIQDLYNEIKLYLNFMNKMDPDIIPMEKYREVYEIERTLKTNGIYEKLSPEYQEAQRKNEMLNAYQQAQRGDIIAIRNFLKDYPNHPEFNAITSLLSKRENELYFAAKQSNRIKDYEDYLHYFPTGEHVDEIKNILLLEREKNAYENVMKKRIVEEAELYLRNYPNGIFHAQIVTLFELLLIEKGEEAMANKDYEKANSLYLKYDLYFPEGPNKEKVKSKQKEAENAFKKQKEIDARKDKTYFLVSYHMDDSYGMEVGKLNVSNKLSTYFRLNVNSYLFSADLFDPYITVDERSEIQENIVPAFFTSAFGLQKKVTYPLWIYAGAGVRWRNHYGKESGWTYEIRERKTWVFYPEVGVKTYLGKAIVLKLGVQFIEGETTFQLGIGV